GAFQDLGDLRLDDLGAGAGIVGAHGNDRRVDVGIFAHGQAEEGDEAEQQHHQADDGGEDRFADEEFEHGSAPGRTVDHLDRGAVAQQQLAGGDDHRAGGETGADL